MAGVDLNIPGEIVDTAEKMNSFKLTVPEDSRGNRRDPKTRYWTEEGKISAASHKKTFVDDNRNGEVFAIVFRLDILITNGCYEINVGQPVSTFLRINYPALRTKDPENLYKMSLMSIGKLKQLFIALGIDADLPNGGYSFDLLQEYFPEETEFPGASPLQNEVLTFEVKQGPKKMDDGSIRENPEVNKFHASA